MEINRACRISKRMYVRLVRVLMKKCGKDRLDASFDAGMLLSQHEFKRMKKLRQMC